MVYKDINDYYLFDLVCENDEVSYGVLFEKYKPLIKKVASSFYHNYNNYGYEFDDFIQEGYVGFYKALKKFNINKSVLFYTFVYLCVSRQMISFVNKISSSYNNLTYLPIDEYDFLCFTKDDIYDNGLNELLKEIILDNPIEYSSVFELRLNNFSFKEIECLLDINYSQAEYRYKKIKGILKEKIRELFI